MPKKFNHYFLIFNSFVSLLILLGCRQNTYIATTSRDMVFATELYNTQFKKKSAIMYYAEDLTEIIQKHPINYVVSEINPNTMQMLKDVPFTNPHQGHEREIFDVQNNMQLLSFSFPIVVVRKDQKNISTLLPNQISLDQLLEESLRFTNTTLSNTPMKLGFYPIEDSFQTIFESNEIYNEWMTNAKINSDEVKKYYQDHYGPSVLINILLDKNIIYKYVSSYSFYQLPFDVQNKFNIYLLNTNDNYTPIVTPLYIGKVNSQSSSSHFLSWLMLPQTHKKIIELKKQSIEISYSTFIENQFSAFWEVDLEVLLYTPKWLWDNKPTFSNIVVPKQIK